MANKDSGLKKIVLIFGFLIIGMLIIFLSNNPIIQDIGIILVIIGALYWFLCYASLYIKEAKLSMPERITQQTAVDDKTKLIELQKNAEESYAKIAYNEASKKYGFWPYGKRERVRKWSSRKGRPVYYYKNKRRW